MWGPDIPVIAPPIALRRLAIVALGFVGFGTFVNFALVPEKPAAPRTYPFSGLVTELGGLDENKVCCFCLLPWQ
jgi:NADH dehydrogenase (ubiquinone) 1 beta subcomplex subunit 8